MGEKITVNLNYFFNMYKSKKNQLNLKDYFSNRHKKLD